MLYIPVTSGIFFDDSRAKYTKHMLKFPALIEWQGRIEIKLEISACA
jgi:hypothetical protein